MIAGDNCTGLIDQLSPEQGAYLGMLPDDRTFFIPGTQPLRVAHGVPGRNRVGFYRQQDAAKIAAEVASVRQRTLISAHTHVQIDRHIHVDEDMQAMLSSDPHVGGDFHPQPSAVHRHWHVINPGSVGLPLDGRPLAQYAHTGQRARDGGTGRLAGDTPGRGRMIVGLRSTLFSPPAC